MCLHDRPEKHKTPAVLWLWTWQLQQVGSNIHCTIAPWGLKLQVCTVAVILAGAGTNLEGGVWSHCQPASSWGSPSHNWVACTRVLFPDSVTSSYLLVTRESLATILITLGFGSHSSLALETPTLAKVNTTNVANTNVQKYGDNQNILCVRHSAKSLTETY